MLAFLDRDHYPQGQKRCIEATKPGLIPIVIILLSYTSSTRASEGALVVLRPYASVINQANSDALSDMTTASRAVAQRVDYRDRYNAFDLSLLSAATGMCSPAEDSNACAFRQANPCQAADRYGANTALCQLPSFLGGNIPNSELCGHGATVDVTLTSSHTNSPGGNTSNVAATLTAFRTRNSSLTLTVTAHSGWLIVPFTAIATPVATNSPGTSNSDDGMDMQQASPAGSAQASTIHTPSPPQTMAPWVLMEGDLSYGDVSAYLTAPARQQPLQQDHEGQLGGQSPPLERYSCYSVRLPLTGLTSACQALGLQLQLRLALVQVKVVAAEQDGPGEASGVGASCELGNSVWQAETSLTLQLPLVQQIAVKDTTAATHTEATLQLQAAARQQAFSDGVVAATAYSVTLDPRSSENIQWLAALAQQFPLLAAIPIVNSLSFLLGVLRPELAQQLPIWTAAGTSTLPLLPASMYLSTCDAASLSVVRDAVLAVLELQGVKQARVASLVCLQPPFSEVAPSELPACAQDTAVLYNITLEVPLEFITTSTSSISSSSTTRGSSSGASKSNSGNMPSPQQLADMLVGAHFTAPWTCLSTEGQMRMSTQLRLELQLPRAVGVEALDVSDGSLLTQVGLAPPPPPLGGSGNSTATPTAAPGGTGSDVSTSGGHVAATGGLRITELLAVCVVAALVGFFVVAAFIVIRVVRQARKAAAEAAAATTTAAIFTMRSSSNGAIAAIAASGAGAVPYSKETAMPQVQQKASLQAEISYDSSIEDAASILLAPADDEQTSQQVQFSGAHKAGTTVGPCEYPGGASSSGGEVAPCVDGTCLMNTVDFSQQGRLATSISPPPSAESQQQTVVERYQPTGSGHQSSLRQQNGVQAPTSLDYYAMSQLELLSCNTGTSATPLSHVPKPPSDGTGPNALGPRPPIQAPPASLSYWGGDNGGDDSGAGPIHGSVGASSPLFRRPGRTLRPVSSTIENGSMQGSRGDTQGLSGQQVDGDMGRTLIVGRSSSGGGVAGHGVAGEDDIRSLFSSSRSLSVASGTTGRPGMTVLSRLRTAAASGAPSMMTMWSNALYDPQSDLHQQHQ